MAVRIHNYSSETRHSLTFCVDVKLSRENADSRFRIWT